MSDSKGYKLYIIIEGGESTMSTDSNIYEPTTAETKLLKVLLDPISIGMTVTDICKEAGVSRRLYYSATSKEGFNNLIKDTALDLLKGKVAHVMNATYKYALEEKGHRDRKLLLEMIGAYADKLEHTGNIGLDLEVKWGDNNDEDD